MGWTYSFIVPVIVDTLLLFLMKSGVPSLIPPLFAAFGLLGSCLLSQKKWLDMMMGIIVKLSLGNRKQLLKCDRDGLWDSESAAECMRVCRYSIKSSLTVHAWVLWWHHLRGTNLEYPRSGLFYGGKNKTRTGVHSQDKENLLWQYLQHRLAQVTPLYANHRRWDDLLKSLWKMLFYRRVAKVENRCRGLCLSWTTAVHP